MILPSDEQMADGGKGCPSWWLDLAQERPQPVHPVAGQHRATGQGGAMAVAEALGGPEDQLKDLGQYRRLVPGLGQEGHLKAHGVPPGPA